MSGDESSEDDSDMPSLLDEISDGDSGGEGGSKKRRSKSKSKSKTLGTPAKVEESPEVKAQKRLEAKATQALEGTLADAALAEDTEVVKKGIAAAKGLEAEVALRLAQRKGKTTQDSLNLKLTQLQEATTALESRLTQVIETEKENKKKLLEQKEQERKEKEIARKKATAEAKKKKAREKHEEEERLRSEQEELDASVKKALDDQKRNKRRTELDSIERKTLLRWNGSCSVVEYVCERPPTMPPTTWEKQHKVHNGQCPICIEDFNEGDRVWRTPCAHAACEDCLEPYLRPFIDTSAAAAGKSQSAYAYAMCALCRAAFDPEEKKAAELAQEADRSRREQENSPPATQENTASATVLASTRVQLSTSSNAAFPALGITAPAESSQAGASSAPPTPEITTALEAAAMLFCAGLSDNFCGADGEARLKVYFEQWGPVKSVKIRGARTEGDRPFAFVVLVDPRHATLALESRHPFKVKRNNREAAAGSSSPPSQTNEAAPESPSSSANNNSNINNSADHLHTTDEPTSNAADKLEDRTVWVGDLHKLSTVGGDAVLVPLISSYFRRFGPLDLAKPLKVRNTNYGQGRDYAFVVFEHARFAEAALRNAVMPNAKLKVEPHLHSKYKHDDSWRQGEAPPAAAATATLAAAAALAVTIREQPAHISRAAPLEAPPPPAQVNTDAPPFASVFATSLSTPAEQPQQVITTAQIQAVKGLMKQRCIGVPIGQGNLVKYVEGAFPEIDKAKVIEAAFGGQINCKVFRWGVADLAALMMKLGYFADPS